jgi:hypothetical protein
VISHFLYNGDYWLAVNQRQTNAGIDVSLLGGKIVSILLIGIDYTAWLNQNLTRLLGESWVDNGEKYA